MRKLKKRRTRKVLLFVLVPLALLGIIMAVISVGMRNKQASSPPLYRQAAMTIEEDEPRDESSYDQKGQWLGLCERGKIHTPSDFQKIVQKDSLLKEYYADFAWHNARIERLEKPVLVTLSYRRDNAINRSTRQIMLPKGDAYVTDGKRKVRTYCCNDYQEVIDAPLQPPAPADGSAGSGGGGRGGSHDGSIASSGFGDLIPEPAAKFLFDGDGNFFTGSTVRYIGADWASHSGGALPRDVSGQDSKFIHDPIPPVPPTPPTVVPEPAEILLIGVGFGVLALRRMLRNRSK